MADNTLPTPERRAELRHSIAVGKAFGMKDGGSNLVYGIELEPLLDATEPVEDKEVAMLLHNLRVAIDSRPGIHNLYMKKAVALIERLLRELAEARQAVQSEGWNPSAALAAISHPIPKHEAPDSEVIWRRFGSEHEKPCKRLGVTTCAMWECQKANQCQWDEATQTRIEP